MKILFLDIDGVLNSRRSATALGRFPWDVSDQDMPFFDLVAIGLIKKLLRETGAVVVLSSSWRNNDTWTEIGPRLGMEIISKTPQKIGLSTRGHEIKHWLDENKDVEAYAIVDDDTDMLPEQEPFFVRTHAVDGLGLKHYEGLLSILGKKTGG